MVSQDILILFENFAVGKLPSAHKIVLIFSQMFFIYSLFIGKRGKSCLSDMPRRMEVDS